MWHLFQFLAHLTPEIFVFFPNLFSHNLERQNIFPEIPKKSQNSEINISECEYNFP